MEILESTPIATSIGLAVAVIVAVAVGTWRVSSIFNSYRDSIKESVDKAKDEGDALRRELTALIIEVRQEMKSQRERDMAHEAEYALRMAIANPTHTVLDPRDFSVIKVPAAIAPTPFTTNT